MRLAAALVALAALVAMAVLLPDTSELHQWSTVQAARTFRLSAQPNGRYRLTELAGRPARGPLIVREQVFRYDTSDLVQLELVADVAPGDRVQKGQVLARVRSPQYEQRLAELKAERDALQAQRSLLAAGGHPEEVRAARQRIEVAKARRQERLAELERTRALAAQGAVSDAELESAELREQVRQLEVDLEQAMLGVARSSARPEALADLDAQLGAADARVAELEALMGSDLVTAPFDGIIDFGSSPYTDDPADATVLQVHDVSSVYLRFPVPETARFHLEPGATVAFSPQAAPDRVFDGTLVELGHEALLVGGTASFWASARVDGADGLLRPGMTGQTRLSLAPGDGSRAGGLWHGLLRP